LFSGGSAGDELTLPFLFTDFLFFCPVLTFINDQQALIAFKLHRRDRGFWVSGFKDLADRCIEGPPIV